MKGWRWPQTIFASSFVLFPPKILIEIFAEKSWKNDPKIHFPEIDSLFVLEISSIKLFTVVFSIVTAPPNPRLIFVEKVRSLALYDTPLG